MSSILKPSKNHRILAILGPTASGKSALAVSLARQFNGEIISADSRQVYRGLDIGSGKVPRDRSNACRMETNKNRIRVSFNDIRERFGRYFYRDIRHHLLDVASPKRTFTAAQYQKLAGKAIRDILRREKLPIICGGTGFYIDALLNGYALPRVKPNPKLRRELEKKSTEALFLELQSLDPNRAREIDRHNRRRLIRALEIIIETGSPVPPLAQNSYSHVLENMRIRKNSVLKIGIQIPAEELKKRIAKRLEERLRGGKMITEVKQLHTTGLSWKRLNDLGLEYRYVSRYVRGRITKNEMAEKIKTESWRYAKRQLTWWKRNKKIQWIKNEREAEKKISVFLKKN